MSLKKSGPFGFAKVSGLKKLREQSLLWMNKIRSEGEFFDVWRSEYERVKATIRERGRLQRERLGKSGLSASNKRAYDKRREVNIAYAREYRAKIKNDPVRLAAHNASCRERKANRRKNDLVYALGVRIRTRIGMAFRYYRVAKRFKSIDALGCSAAEYKTYIESLMLPGMTWENYGRKGWHIDHKHPIASFDLTKDDQVSAAFHYTNTQPLWWLDNLIKGNRTT